MATKLVGRRRYRSTSHDLSRYDIHRDARTCFYFQPHHQALTGLRWMLIEHKVS